MRYRFAAHLARYGPQRRYILPMTLSHARLYCERLACSHYENFLVGTLLLPRELRPHFFTIYSYCRWADDLADETGGGPTALTLLHWWERQVRDCFRGEASHPVMIALNDTARKFGIPLDPFVRLLGAFTQDQIVHRYQTFADVRGYCRGSADPVGRLLLYLFGCFDEENAELSDRICTGLQLANFCQDVGRDLQIGRIYFPREDWERFGVREEDIVARRCTEQFRAMMRFQVERARDYLYRGLPLAERVPPGVRVEVELFARGGLAILERVERQGFDVFARRPKVSKWKQGRLFIGALARRYLGSRL